MIGVSNSWESSYGKGSLVLLFLCCANVGRENIGKIKMFDDCKKIIIMREAAAAAAAKSLQNTHQNVAISRF